MSSRRLYLGNLPRDVTKSEIERHFDAQNTGAIAEVKLMSGFGFLEYKDPSVAAEVVPSFNGTELMGERLVVQFARGTERPPRSNYDYPMQRAAPRPRRTVHRMTLNGLPPETSWQDLKDFARQPGLDVVFSEVGRRDAEGTGFVEYETGEDLQQAVDKLDGADFKGSVVRCIADTQNEVPRADFPPPRGGGGGGRYRSRSPGPRYGGGPPGGRGYDDYDRRGPPPGRYDGGRDEYRRRSPPGYDRRGPPEPYYGGGGRSPGGPRDDYGGPPRRRGYGDEGSYGGPPPRRGGYGGDSGYAGREPRGEPRGDYGRERSPPRGERRGGGYDGGYERRGGY